MGVVFLNKDVRLFSKLLLASTLILLKKSIMNKNIKHKLGFVVYYALVVIMIALMLYSFYKQTQPK